MSTALLRATEDGACLPCDDARSSQDEHRLYVFCLGAPHAKIAPVDPTPCDSGVKFPHNTLRWRLASVDPEPPSQRPRTLDDLLDLRRVREQKRCLPPLCLALPLHPHPRAYSWTSCVPAQAASLALSKVSRTAPAPQVSGLPGSPPFPGPHTDSLPFLDCTVMAEGAHGSVSTF